MKVGQDTPDAMRCVTVHVKQPVGSWCRVASAHRDIATSVLSCLPSGKGWMIETVHLQGAGWRDLVAEIRPLTRRLDVLDDQLAEGTIRVVVPACGLPPGATASGLHPTFPFDLDDGKDTWQLVGGAAETQAFVLGLRAHGMSAEVMAVQPDPPRGPLTARQRVILTAARAAGYYDYPRRITLSRLAGRLGLAKSTLSEALVRIESVIIGAKQTRGVDPL